MKKNHRLRVLTIALGAAVLASAFLFFNQNSDLQGRFVDIEESKIAAKFVELEKSEIVGMAIRGFDEAGNEPATLVRTFRKNQRDVTLIDIEVENETTEPITLKKLRFRIDDVTDLFPGEEETEVEITEPKTLQAPVNNLRLLKLSDKKILDVPEDRGPIVLENTLERTRATYFEFEVDITLEPGEPERVRVLGDFGEKRTPLRVSLVHPTQEDLEGITIPAYPDRDLKALLRSYLRSK